MTYSTYPAGTTRDERIEASARAKIAREAASTEQTLRRETVELDLKIKAQEAKLALAEKRQAATDATKAARAKKKTARRAEKKRARRAAISGAVEYVRTHTVAVYCAVIYGMSVAVAVLGQISMAEARGWPVIMGVGIAVFVEGIALSMALTGHEMRMRGERAFMPRVLTWAAAGFAAAVNYTAHAGSDTVLAIVFAASSLAGITVWEVRSAAKHRTELRDKGLIPEPPVRFGFRRWLRYPRSSFQAWSLDIRDRSAGRAGQLLTAASRAPGWRARHRQARLDKLAAKNGAPIINLTYLAAEDPPAVWEVPESITHAGARRPAGTDQTGPVAADQTSDQTDAGPALRSVPGPVRSADAVGAVRPVRSVRPAPTVRAIESGPAAKSETGPTPVMAEVFAEAVADGVLIGHLTMRDRAAERLDGRAIDPSFARRLHDKLVARLDADVLADLRKEVA